MDGQREGQKYLPVVERDRREVVEGAVEVVRDAAARVEQAREHRQGRERD